MARLGTGRSIKPVLYIEGQRIDNGFISATCTSQVGKPATAVINLVPTNTIRHIMPRTYVHLYVNDPWREDDTDPYLMFEGEVLGMGLVKNDDSRAFVLHCADVSNYWHHVRQYWFNITQSGGNFLDEFIRMTTGGQAKIATVAPMGVKGYLIQRLNLVSGEENLFLDSLIGLLDDIGNISSFYQNARRRLRITDRVLRKNAGLVENLFQLSFFSDWIQQLIQARSGETNLLTIITLLMNVIYHEYVSVLAPPYVKTDVIKRDKHGNPIRKKDKKGSLRSVETEEAYAIGNFIFKPHIYTLPPPSCNVLFPNMVDGVEYHRNFTEENTRMTLTPQVVERGALSFLKMKVFKRPTELDTFFNLITEKQGSQNTLRKRPKEAKYGDGMGQSAQVQEWEFFTNEERFKGIIPKFQSMAPAPAILSLQNQGKKDSAGKRTGGAPRYLHNVASYEYFMNKFVSRSLNTSGPFNLRPVPGYPLLILDDSEAGMNMVAYLQGISHTVHASSGSSTSYSLALPREVEEADLNRARLDEKTGFFEFSTENGERVFDFDKMFDSEHLPPIPEWFDDDFKTIGKLTELYQSFFGDQVSSCEDLRKNGVATGMVNPADAAAFQLGIEGNKTNSIFRQSVKLLMEDYEASKAANNEFAFVSKYTERALCSVSNAFRFIGATPKNYREGTAPPVADTEYVGSAVMRSFTKAEVDPDGESTSSDEADMPVFNGKPYPHPFEMKIYNDSVAAARKANEKSTKDGKKRTRTPEEQAPTGISVEGTTAKPVSYPLSENQILKARRSVISKYRSELRGKRGFRG